ncbi:hypothetical protein BX666DRAFT_2126182 [Dichotomocladium elegans]|nr:hypothetical protein BX666DRAFT_2126182 [Dichotomocladium elegans]
MTNGSNEDATCSTSSTTKVDNSRKRDPDSNPADPPPIAESIAKDVVQTMLRYLNHTTVGEEHDYSTTSSVSTLTQSKFITVNDTTSDITGDLHKAASRVIYYLSTHNWMTVYRRAKLNLSQHSIASEENVPMYELRLFECAALNQKRLTRVLSAVCANLMHLKKDTQLFLAVVLRRAIWSWIENFPSEFIDLCHEQKRLEGGPEILFDICDSLADVTRRKAIFWPLQTMLLIIAPDVLLTSVLAEGRDAQNKKTIFLNTLKRSLKGSRMAELAAICYIDICKAATYVSDPEDSALRLLVPEVESELINKLFDIHNPLIADSLMVNLGIVIDHHCLLADCLVALFRLNSEGTIPRLFPICLNERAPVLFKSSLIKACLILATDENQFPWNPSISVLYDYMCAPLRRLFIELSSTRPEVNSHFSTASRKMAINPSIDKKKRMDTRTTANYGNNFTATSAATSSTAEDTQKYLLLEMLQLYQIDPNNGDRFEQNLMMMVAITHTLRDPRPYVRDCAAECLIRLHSPDCVMAWGPSHRYMEAFWRISSQVVYNIARQLLDTRESVTYIKKLLGILSKILAQRNDFLQLNEASWILGSDVRERLQAMIALEVALLILLCAADPSICSDAITCFGQICQEARLCDIADDPHQSASVMTDNLPLYNELTSSIGIVEGRKSQQKRIRRLLRLMTHSAPGNLAAWEEAWKRWKYMTPLIVKPQEEFASSDLVEGGRKGPGWHDKFRNNAGIIQARQSPTLNPPVSSRMDYDSDRAAEWQNYAGFLAALGGVCLMAGAASTPPSSSSSLPTWANQQSNSQTSTPNESALMAERFVTDMIDLLVCDNVIIREWVREILGTDLSPALYPIMFRHFEDTLSKCFATDRDPITSPRYTLFVEQAISVLKLVLDRMDETVDNLFTVDFSEVVAQYAQYLNKLNGQHSMRVKIKMCQLCEVLMLRKDRITLRQEFRLRNKLLEIIVEWTSDFSLNRDTSSLRTNEPTAAENLQLDLDLACLKTIQVLLNQLPLQSSDPVQEDDSVQIKSRMFYKYFSFFLKLLNRCRISEIESSPRAAPSQVMVVNKNKECVTVLAPLKNYTILAMSNLLSANVDAGLKYSLSMGYHEDSRIRTAFMQVLTNILDQGTEFETLAETVMTDRYEKLVDMIVEFDLNIALSLCDVCPSSEIDEIANILLACFASRNKTLVLLEAIIEKEVASTTSESDLFRKTSIGTRMLSVFARNYGADYVQSVIQPVFQQLVEYPPEARTFELDPTKVGPGEDAERNRQNVVKATDLFLNAICDSANQAPQIFREVCNCILRSVVKRFPEAMHSALGAFVFLRFFCPAIVAPESEGTLVSNTAIIREMRRGMMMVTKVIQNLANNVLFGAKETYMIVLNDFVTSNFYKVTNFLREISRVPIADTKHAEATEAYHLDDKDYAMLHRILSDNMERIARDLTARRMRHFNNEKSIADSKAVFDNLAKLLAQLGRPPEISKKEFGAMRSYRYAAANQLYAEFMRRNSHRSVDAIVSKNIFYEGGVSRNRRPVFYLILRNIIADSIDFELLTYYILQTIERVSSQQFEVVVDLTLFGPANEVPCQWISQLLQLLPFDATENVVAIHMYNPNSSFRKFMKRLQRPVSHKFSKYFTSSATLLELQEYINVSEIRLPNSTTALETEPNAVYFPVNRISQFKAQVPVTVKISAEYIQIMTVRKQELMFNVNAVTNDVFHISDIEDISVAPPGRGVSSATEFSFKCNGGKSQVTLATPKRDAMVNSLRHSKRRYEMSRPSTLTDRAIRPNDVPGRLLNMALLNIGSDDPSLRVAAYNLLHALSINFNFDIGRRLLEAKDLCLPANNTEFIVSISEKIAASEPGFTLEFLSECFVGFNKSSESLRYLCLDYMIPWLPNLALYSRGSAEEVSKAKEVLRLLVDLTVARTDMYKLIQAKIWKTLGKVDEVLNLVLDVFTLYSIQHGIGSAQAEAMADTLVTLSNVALRGKVISRLRKALLKTSSKPTRNLNDHPLWTEIAVLIRFILMLSFNNRGPVKSYIPEIFHIVTLVVGVGPSFLRASVHGLVVNMIQSLCTSMPLTETNFKKMQLILTELSDSKSRVLFGLARPGTGPFTIGSDTLSDVAEPIRLASLETIVIMLMDVLHSGAPSTDVANAWRARWMGLIASTAFQFNPAVQPRAFVVLGCLGRDEIDDDLLYQILVALRGALAIFNETDPYLVLSIMMCLKNIVESLPSDSHYLLPLFWVAMSLVQLNHSPIFGHAVEFLQAVLRALDSVEMFVGNTVAEVLLAAREPMADVARELDQLCGVNFESHFSFAVAGTLMKGLRHSNAKDPIYQGLSTFLDIECKQRDMSDMIEARALGYVIGLLPVAAKNELLKDLLQLSGLDDADINDVYALFDRLDIPDNTTALLLTSFLATQLNAADNESERQFIYALLAESAMAMPEVFALVYEMLLPGMNQIVISSVSHSTIESVKSILLTSCSDPAFNDNINRRNQKLLLEEIGFSALGDPTFGAASTNVLEHAKLASELVEKLIA